VPQAYLPEQRRFYYPGKLGAESRIKERLRQIWKRFADDPTDDSVS
jgi:putative ATPase